MLGVFDRRVQFSPCSVSTYLGVVQGQLYLLIGG